ncbi:radical SAM family heme chaperone HemW [Catenovulum sp. 2E275]|uniref:radical SAM family heme chaperone HemW n=1 Tax=Catenovulum sp. 2E275 TaxID=2980497 RepID=UPI0021D0D922|nr:radical SAM family heme chaperone HemW [Catenovulum sp. 2E275]MCU4675976.1 radical SAM family heme chaperone HemW [Catenovulum sp. 2E275]
MQLPDLSLYIHIPWCVQKCPYCDFNSHAVKNPIPEDEYIDCLLDDLKQDLALAQGRSIQSIFFGGGTPSIFSAAGIARILAGVKALLPLAQHCEITLEANPGTFEIEKFKGFKQAGVNRFSIGVQSLQSQQLNLLGRIHNPEEAKRAAKLAGEIGLNSFNLDLMHGLPNQTLTQALSDLQQVIDLKPQHISWYQLTIEENTLFASRPPKLPEDDILWDIQTQGQALLAQHGYQQYEISAYCQSGFESKHNLNYWQFGDYLAIGCGAHGKITLPKTNQILRYEKVKHPKGYLDKTQDYTYNTRYIEADDMPFEYFMNRFRLKRACPKAEFSQFTGMDLASVEPMLQKAVNLNLIEETTTHWQVTQHGHRYLNDLLELFV